MMGKLTFLLVLASVQFLSVHCIFGSDHVCVTDYINSKNTAGGKLASRVYNPELVAMGLTSYSGYFTVNKTYDSNLFFWYFPAKNDPKNAPVVLWLQGGPGASSLYGMFMENGPVFLNQWGRLEKRQYSWHLDHHVIYIDNPVGAGFSYTNNDAGYATNEVDVGTNLFSAVRQFFQLFPELKNNRFYITGESYGGKYVPALGHQIYSKRSSSNADDRINLRGIAIGNGVTDPVHQIMFGDYFYQLGYIDQKALATFNQYQQAALNAIAQKNYTLAAAYTFALINSPGCLFNNLTGFTSPYNSLKLDGYNPEIDKVTNWFATSGIEKDLHTGGRKFVPFADKNYVLQKLIADILDSVIDWVAELANNYFVVIYNGQLDLLVSTMLTENYLNKMSFNGQNEFLAAPRYIWDVNGKEVGYWKKGGNLYHCTVRLAGHMVPYDQPAAAYDLLRRLTCATSTSVPLFTP